MNYDWIMNAPVRHKKYGEGIVKSLQGMYLEVHFQLLDKTLKFIYPESFENIIEMLDESLIERVKKDVMLRKALVEEAERISIQSDPEKLKKKQQEEELTKKRNAAILKKKLLERQNMEKF